MKKVYFLLTFFLILFFSFKVEGQLTVHLNEDFENLPDTTPDKLGVLPIGWSTILEYGTKPWRFKYGGFQYKQYPTDPDDPDLSWPHTPKSGRRNALFQAESDFWRAKLVTKKLDLSTASRPVLKFYVAQNEWFGQCDFLNVYYKNCGSCPWIPIDSVSLHVTKMNWTYQEYQLQNLSNDYYIAFEGVSNRGYGVCIDSVVVVDDSIKPRELKEVKIFQSSMSKVPQGYMNAPILRVDFKVIGNQNSIKLNSINFDASYTDVNTLVASGQASLFRTTDTIFNAATPVGTTQNFSGNTISFSGLDADLPTGTTSVWLCYNVKSSAFVDKQLDATISVNQINAGGKTWPAQASPANGNRKIVATIFHDSFEAGGWTLIPEFEIGNPAAITRVGMIGYPHPENAYSGTQVLGTDITGTIFPNITPGFYESAIPYESSYTAISPAFTAKYYKNVNLSFQRWLNLHVSDYATVDVSGDGGTAWTDLLNLTNLVTIADEKWRNISMNAKDLDRKNNSKIRFTLGPTSSFSPRMSGWTIDDLFVTGDQVNYDIATTQLVAPNSTCGLGNESIVAKFTNQGLRTIKGNVNVSYTVNDGTAVNEVFAIPDSILPGNSINYTFTQKADLSEPILYYVKVKAALVGHVDDDHRNDSIIAEVRSMPVFTPNPETKDDFENTLQQYWFSGGTGNSWGETAYYPVGTTIDHTPSTPPVNNYFVWRTARNNGNEMSYVESPCYDFSQLSIPVFSFNYFVNVEKTGTSGALLSFSLDKGLSWTYLPATSGPAGWKWYNSAISLFGGKIGFSSKTQLNWETGRLFLPDILAGQPSVKLRVEFAATDDEYGDGFAFDNVRILEAPVDLGITETSIVSACETKNPLPVTITVKNFGYKDINAGDTIYVAVKIDNNEPIRDTIELTDPILKEGGTDVINFSKTIPVNMPGTYNLKVYTSMEAEPTFYGANNDTLNRIITIYPLPYPTMPDSILSRQPHNVILSTGVTPGSNYNFAWSDNKGGNGTDSIYRNAAAWKGYTAYVHITHKTTSCSNDDTTRIILLFNDVKMDSIAAPVNNGCDTVKIYPKILFKHVGNDTIMSGDSVRLYYRFKTNPVVSETYYFTTSLVKNQTREFTFSKPINMNEFDQSYFFAAVAKYVGDTVTSNDSISKTAWIYQPPVFTLPYHDTTVYGVSFPMSVTAIPNVVNYTWTDVQTKSEASGSDMLDYNASSYGYHKLTITDNHTCQDSDSVFVKLLFFDVSPRLVSPVSACAHETSELLQVSVKNTGTDTISTGSVVTIAYRINSGSWRTETKTLTSTFNKGDSIIHTFLTPENLSAKATYNVTVVGTIIGKDMKKFNDTISSSFKTFGYPIVDLCSGYTCNTTVTPRVLTVTGASYKFTAGTDTNYTYTWAPGGSHQSTFTASAKGTYSVFVTDATTGCSKTDQIFLNLVIPDISLTGITISDSVCEKDINEITMELTNTGNTNISDTVWFFYKINNLDSASFSIKPSPALNPLAKLSHKFTGIGSKVNSTAPNRFDLAVKMKSDVKLANNDSTIMVNILPHPLPFDLGAPFSASSDTISRLAGTSIILDPGTLDPNYTYLWNDGTTQKNKVVSTEGKYTLTITNQYHCSTKDSLYVTYHVNLISISGGALKIYPNPASVHLNINLESQTNSDLTIQIISMDGKTLYNKMVKAGNEFSDKIDVRSFAKGLYLIKVSNSQITSVGKVMIE